MATCYFICAEKHVIFICEKCHFFELEFFWYFIEVNINELDVFLIVFYLRREPLQWTGGRLLFSLLLLLKMIE